MVIGELALGSISQGSAVLDNLNELPAVTIATHGEVMHLIEEHRLFGQGLSLVGAHLLASVLLTPPAQLWTRDKRLAAAARAAGAVIRQMTEAADFIDGALQYEVSPYVWPSEERDGLLRYGTSVGAIRGTVRDAQKRYPGMSHDDITALSSELWAQPVFERRQAAVILLQSHVDLLVAGDLTRIEGFIRTAKSSALVDQLVTDVLIPLLAAMDERALARVRVVIARWAVDSNALVRAAAEQLPDGQLHP